MTTKQSAPVDTAALGRLAARLEQEHDSILADWRAEAAANGEATIVKTLTRSEFYDHIPNFLRRLCAALRGARDTTRVPALQHGAHRWQQGLDFVEVVHEWQLLRHVIMERVAALYQPLGLNPATTQEAFRLLALSMDDAIAESLDEFHRHLRVTAASRARDLEAALETRSELDDRRGRSLHEATHDLRGSLQAVVMAVDLLREKARDDDLKGLVERLSLATDGLGQMLENLLDLARLEAGREKRNITHFDAAALFRKLARSLAPLAEANQLWLEARGPETLPVQGDETKVQRIAQNLVLNALKYTRSGGVEVTWQADSRARWSFRVHDTGDGLSAAAADEFAAGIEEAAGSGRQTLEATGKDGKEESEAGVNGSYAAHGEGIGLSIVHHLCQLLDAVLEVDSRPGRGATFRVLLPRKYPE